MRFVPYLVGIGVLALIVLVYWPVIGYGSLPTWDDTNFVVHRPEILDWWGSSWFDRLVNPKIGYPIPIPTALYSFLRHTFGEDGYFGVLHTIHLALHLVNAGLAYFLLRWIWSKYELPGRLYLPLMVASVWALHPVLVESVAWLTNTKNLLSNSAILAALCLQTRVGEIARIPQSLGLVLLYVLAIGSRPDGAFLPFLLGWVLLAIYGKSLRTKVNRIWLATLGVLCTISIPFVIWASRTHAEIAERKERSMTGIVEILFRMGRAVEFSAGSLALPLNLHPSYFYIGDETIVDALPGLALIALVLAAMVVMLRRPDPHYRAAGFGLAFLAASFFPYSNIVFLPRLAADTYLYLPALGFTIALGAFLSAIDKRGSISVLVILLAAFAFLTHKQVQRWENAITLWEPVTHYEPTLDRSYRHIAFEHFRHKRFEEGAEVIDRALPHFRRERDIPWYAIVIYREARGPLAAAEVGMEARLKNDETEPDIHKAFVETLLIGKIPPPNDPELQRVIRESMEHYQTQSEWMQNESAGPAIQAYLSVMANSGQ